jgi:hypothetical protein
VATYKCISRTDNNQDSIGISTVRVYPTRRDADGASAWSMIVCIDNHKHGRSPDIARSSAFYTNHNETKVACRIDGVSRLCTMRIAVTAVNLKSRLVGRLGDTVCRRRPQARTTMRNFIYRANISQDQHHAYSALSELLFTRVPRPGKSSLRTHFVRIPSWKRITMPTDSR